MASTPTNNHRKSIGLKMTTTSIRVGSQPPTPPTSSKNPSSFSSTSDENKNTGSSSTVSSSNSKSTTTITKKKLSQLPKLDTLVSQQQNLSKNDSNDSKGSRGMYYLLNLGGKTQDNCNIILCNHIKYIEGRVNLESSLPKHISATKSMPQPTNTKKPSTLKSDKSSSTSKRSSIASPSTSPRSNSG